MFKSIKHIPVDRKNSLPVSDLQVRYRRTGTPVVFGDLSKYWPASSKWSTDYLSKSFGDIDVPVYSEQLELNRGQRFKPILQTNLARFFELQQQEGSDFRISRLLLSQVPELEKDFSYPRLGFDFFTRLTSLCIGGQGVLEPMRQTSSVMHTVRCHFGERASVLLVPAAQSQFVYAIGRSGITVRDVDYNQPQFNKYPALKGIQAYVAELNDGDSLYVPPGFWHCTYYHGAGVTLVLQSASGKLSQYFGVLGNHLVNRASKLFESTSIDKNGFTRAEREAVVSTNARFQKLLKKSKS
ncbi:cupin-like domain-containing protein [Arenicella xantha]|uniref:Cupin-like protein n=1 Tax=Arenicella xantha TaxID=644221 RepID=A0A395JLU1_9GAMM|nr:cupin-like domain-containing protein [Arenicella xantha]RBP51766.1 cupin-like protein [Arenicella xantha]